VYHSTICVTVKKKKKDLPGVGIWAVRVHIGLKSIHLLCATHTLGALQAQIPRWAGGRRERERERREREERERERDNRERALPAERRSDLEVFDEVSGVVGHDGEHFHVDGRHGPDQLALRGGGCVLGFRGEGLGLGD